MHDHTACQSFDKLKIVPSVLSSGHTNYHQKSFASSESYMSNPAYSYRILINDDVYLIIKHVTILAQVIYYWSVPTKQEPLVLCNLEELGTAAGTAKQPNMYILNSPV